MDHYESIKNILRKSFLDSPRNVSSALYNLTWDLSHKEISEPMIIAKLQLIYNLTDAKTDTAKSIENYLMLITNETAFYY